MDDGDRRNPPPMPSTYVTLVQLEQRWLQEKQRKQREKEEQERQQKIEIEKEERKREEQQRQQDEEANLQKTRVESTTALLSRNRRPPLRTNRSIQSEKSQCRAIVVSDGESKTGDLKKEEKKNKQRYYRWKAKWKSRAEETLISGREHLSVEKEDLSEQNSVVSAERDYEKEIGGKCEGVSSSGGKRGDGKYSRGVKNWGKPRVEEDLSNGKEKLVKNEVEAENIAVVSTEKHGKFMGNGKDLVVNNGRVWEKKARGVDGEVLVGVLRKVEGLSVRSGRGGNGKYGGIENGSPRRYRWSSGRVNSQRVEMPRASNLVWVRKEEGEASDANVAGD